MADVQAQLAVEDRARRGVVEIERRAGAQGRLDLPTITREELRTLGDTGVLPEAADLEWWAALAPAEREQVASAAARGLLARGLVESSTATGRTPGELLPELVLVLAARQEPLRVVVVGAATGGQPTQALAPDEREPLLRGYVVPIDEGPELIVILEQVLDGLRRLVACSLAVGAERLLQWLSHPSASGSERALQVIGPGVGERPDSFILRLISGPCWRGVVGLALGVLGLLAAVRAHVLSRRRPPSGADLLAALPSGQPPMPRR